MKIVVLAGGTSTERDVSIVSGTGICQALRQKGHQAILVDVFCGLETVNWEDPFPAEYDVEKAAEYIKGFNPQMKELKKARTKTSAGFLFRSKNWNDAEANRSFLSKKKRCSRAS